MLDACQGPGPLNMRVVVPDGVEQVAAPPLSLEEVPGAELVLHAAWRGEGSELMVACATRPVPIWVDGLSPAVFGGLNGMVRRHLDLRVVRAGERRREGEHQVQDFTGEGSDTAVVGRHQVGFADAATLMGCTVVCEGRDASVCDTQLRGLHVDAGFVAREPRAAERVLTSMLEHPRQAVGVVGLAIVVATVWVLRRRPRESEL